MAIHSTAKHPKCPRCHTSGYTQSLSPSGDRPGFTCDSCGHEWSQGLSGGVYTVQTVQLLRAEGEEAGR